MKSKNIVTVVLLLFVGASVVVLAMKSLRRSESAAETVEPRITDGVIVYYFHGKTRCVTCNTIEARANEAVEASFAEQIEAGLLQWRVVNFELPENEHFKEQYKLIASSVVLVQNKDGSQQQWKNLDRVWELVRGDKEPFLKYVEEETRVLLDDFSTQPTKERSSAERRTRPCNRVLAV